MRRRSAGERRGRRPGSLALKRTASAVERTAATTPPISPRARLPDLGDVAVEPLGSQHLVDAALLAHVERQAAQPAGQLPRLAQVARQVLRAEDHHGHEEHDESSPKLRPNTAAT